MMVNKFYLAECRLLRKVTPRAGSLWSVVVWAFIVIAWALAVVKVLIG